MFTLQARLSVPHVTIARSLCDQTNANDTQGRIQRGTTPVLRHCQQNNCVRRQKDPLMYVFAVRLSLVSKHLNLKSFFLFVCLFVFFVFYSLFAVQIFMGSWGQPFVRV